MKFKVGDHVVGNESADVYVITRRGWQGEVVGVCGAGRTILVRALPGHSGGSANYPVAAHCFDLIPRKEGRKIVVTVDGETTTARLYNGKVLEKSAEVKCSPGDRFDFNVGAGLAIDRLLDRESTKPGGFPLEELKSGRFGRLNNGEWFVVLEDRMLYLNGSEGWDRITDLDRDGAFPSVSKDSRRVDIIVAAVSLRDAKRTANKGHFVWARTYKKV